MKRRPAAAGLASVLLPGLGHAYCGQLLKGIALFIAFVSSALLMLLGMLWLPLPPWNVIVPFCLVLAVYGGILVDSIRTARRVGDDFQPRFFNRWYVYIGSVLLGGLIFQPWLESAVRESIVEAVSIPTIAMEPTILEGDYLLLDRMTSDRIARGDIVAFRWPNEAEGRFLFRVLGLPRDTLEMRGGRTHANGIEISEGYKRDAERTDTSSPDMRWQEEFLAESGSDSYHPTRDSWGPLLIPDAHYFVVGDNRGNSYDSRYRGLVPERSVQGRARRIYLSWDSEDRKIRWDRIGLGVR